MLDKSLCDDITIFLCIENSKTGHIWREGRRIENARILELEGTVICPGDLIPATQDRPLSIFFLMPTKKQISWILLYLVSHVL